MGTDDIEDILFGEDLKPLSPSAFPRLPKEPRTTDPKEVDRKVKAKSSKRGYSVEPPKEKWRTIIVDGEQRLMNQWGAIQPHAASSEEKSIATTPNRKKKKDDAWKIARRHETTAEHVMNLARQIGIQINTKNSRISEEDSARIESLIENQNSNKDKEEQAGLTSTSKGKQEAKKERIRQLREEIRLLSASRQTRKDETRLVGTELLEFTLDQSTAETPEVNICIRAGYKSDDIGKFRTAFSNAAKVPLAPLGRMIKSLREKEGKEKRDAYEYHQPTTNLLHEITNSTRKEDSIELITQRRSIEVRSTTRVRNAGFRNAVLKAHEYKCACCGIDIPELLEAAHIVPVANDGTDHPSNGIALCPTHHSAFDRHYFTFEPGSRKLILKEGITTYQLHISSKLLGTDVNDECLALRQRLFNAEIKD